MALAVGCLSLPHYYLACATGVIDVHPPLMGRDELAAIHGCVVRRRSEAAQHADLVGNSSMASNPDLCLCCAARVGVGVGVGVGVVLT